MNKTFIMTDDNDISRNAELITLFQYNNQLYSLYHIDRDETTTNLFMSEANEEDSHLSSSDIENQNTKSHLVTIVKTYFQSITESLAPTLPEDITIIPQDQYQIETSHFNLQKAYAFTSKKSIVQEAIKEINSHHNKETTINIPTISISKETNLQNALPNKEQKPTTPKPIRINIVPKAPNFSDQDVYPINTSDAIMVADIYSIQKIRSIFGPHQSELSNNRLNKKTTAKSLIRKPLPQTKAGFVNTTIVLIGGITLTIATIIITITIIKRILP